MVSPHESQMKKKRKRPLTSKKSLSEKASSLQMTSQWCALPPVFWEEVSWTSSATTALFKEAPSIADNISRGRGDLRLCKDVGKVLEVSLFL